MTRCDWIRTPGAEWPTFRCSRCGQVVEVRGSPEEWLPQMPPCGVLAGSDPPISVAMQPRPSPATKVARYTKAIARWIAAGRPRRSDEEVKRIFERHCRPCSHFDAGKRTCTVCGCRVRATGIALMNKIKMATERCPKRHW